MEGQHILESHCLLLFGLTISCSYQPGAIRAWAARVIHINDEMENYEAGVYAEKVLEVTKLLFEIVMPCFTE